MPSSNHDRGADAKRQRSTSADNIQHESNSSPATSVHDTAREGGISSEQGDNAEDLQPGAT